jgi:hypothetical protein
MNDPRRLRERALQSLSHMRSSLLLAVLLSACVVEADAGEPALDPTEVTAEPQLAGAPGATWDNQSIPEQGGTFHIVFAFVPSEPGGGPIDAVVGLSDGAADGFADLGPIVRFSPAGTLDVRNGSAYEADTVFAYRAGETYQIWIDVNMTRGRYSVQVQENGGRTTRIAYDYAFRTEQAGLSRVNNVGRFVDSTTGSLQQIAVEVTSDPAR